MTDDSPEQLLAALREAVARGKEVIYQLQQFEAKFKPFEKVVKQDRPTVRFVELEDKLQTAAYEAAAGAAVRRTPVTHKFTATDQDKLLRKLELASQAIQRLEAENEDLRSRLKDPAEYLFHAIDHLLSK